MDEPFALERLSEEKKSAEEELKAIRQRLSTTFPPPLIWFSAIPIPRRSDYIPVDVAKLRSIVEKSSYFTTFPERAKVLSGATPSKYADQIEPSGKGVETPPNDSNECLLEIARDATIVFGIKSHDKDMQLWLIYETWLSGLYLLKDIQKHYGLSGFAVVQAGLFGFEGIRVVGKDGRHLGKIPFGSNEENMDSVTLDESWTPTEQFESWATQLSNCLQVPKAIGCPPWIE